MSAQRLLVVGLGLLLGLSTLDEGGAAPRGLLAWHALLVVLLGLALATERSARHRLAPAPLAAYAIFSGVALVGALRAPYAYAAWLGLLELGAFLAVAALAARCGPGLPRRLALPLLLFGAGHACLALVQRFAWHDAAPAGGFLNPNHLAGWLVAVLLVTWAGGKGSEYAGTRGAPLRVAASVPIVAAIVLTASRGATVGLVVGLAAAIGASWQRISPRTRRTVLVGALVLLGVVGAGLVVRLSRPDPFRYQRVEIWRASARLVADHPWFGSGPRQFGVAARAYQFADRDGPLRYDRRFSRPHSDLLRVAGELGLPGLLALAALLGTAVASARRRRLPAEGEDGPDAGAVAALLALGAQSLVENLSETPAIYLLAALLLGSRLAVPRAGARPVPRGLRAVLAVVLLLVFVVGDLAPFLAWSELRRLPRGRLPVDAAERLDEAVQRNRMHPETRSRLAEHLAAPSPDWDLDGYAAAREAAEHALRLQPVGSEYHVALARVDGQACRSLFVGDPATRERAARAYERAEKLDPFNPLIPLERAALLLDCGDPSGAAAAAEKAVRLEPEAATPRVVLAGALLAARGPGARPRAEALLAEAGALSRRWSAWGEASPYARALLRPDPSLTERVRQALGASAASPVRGSS